MRTVASPTTTRQQRQAVRTIADRITREQRSLAFIMRGLRHAAVRTRPRLRLSELRGAALAN